LEDLTKLATNERNCTKMAIKAEVAVAVHNAYDYDYFLVSKSVS